MVRTKIFAICDCVMCCVVLCYVTIYLLWNKYLCVHFSKWEWEWFKYWLNCLHHHPWHLCSLEIKRFQLNVVLWTNHDFVDYFISGESKHFSHFPRERTSINSWNQFANYVYAKNGLTTLWKYYCWMPPHDPSEYERR